MEPTEFYIRPMVQRLLEIFDHPSPPAVVTQPTFGFLEDDYTDVCHKMWHEITFEADAQYLLDIQFVEIQQDLFDYIFPAFLIRWWEDQLSQQGGVKEIWGIYGSFSQCDLLNTMISPQRGHAIKDWIVDAYVDGVDLSGSRDSSESTTPGSYRIDSALWSFHALGQSVPTARLILERLRDVKTQGRARWWLVCSSGIAWNDNECPFVAPWNLGRSNGGIFVLGSGASDNSEGYLSENLLAMNEVFSIDTLQKVLATCQLMFESEFERNWVRAVQTRFAADPALYQRRIERFLACLRLKDLGGFGITSLDDTGYQTPT